MPSIMPLGAMMSAPASAWLTAVSATSFKVASLSSSSPRRWSGLSCAWPAAGREHAAVAVVGVLAEAEVGQEHEIGVAGLELAEGLLDDAVLGVSARGLGVLMRRNAEQDGAGMPRERASSTASMRVSTEYWCWPGMEEMAFLTPLPGRTNRGAMKSPGWSARSRGRGRGGRGWSEGERSR